MRVEGEERFHLSTLRLLAIRTCWIFLFFELGYTYTPWSVVPWIGALVSRVAAAPVIAISQWLALHLFHLQGVAATDHSTDSRDTALSWIALIVLVLASTLAASVWTFFDRSGQDEERCAIWFRYLLRISLIFIMLRYGLFKLFPLQMSRPSLGVLNEQVGQTSPMTLLWTLIGLKPFYQIGSGAMETISGLLLVFERTSVPGALLGAVIMANVVWLNLAFDIPVKLGAIQILVAFGALLWPHIQAISMFLLKAGPRELRVRSLPEFRSKRSIRLAKSIEFAYVGLSLLTFVPISYRQAVREAKAVEHPSPFTGEWKVYSDQEQVVSSAVRTAEGSPLSALFLEPDGRAMARSEDGRLWRGSVQINPKKQTITLDSGYFEADGFGETYSYTVSPEQDRLLLKGTPERDGTVRQFALHRVQLPSTYPLVQDRMHWIQEWAIER